MHINIYIKKYLAVWKVNHKRYKYTRSIYMNSFFTNKNDDKQYW